MSSSDPTVGAQPKKVMDTVRALLSKRQSFSGLLPTQQGSVVVPPPSFVDPLVTQQTTEDPNNNRRTGVLEIELEETNRRRWIENEYSTQMMTVIADEYTSVRVKLAVELAEKENRRRINVLNFKLHIGKALEMNRMGVKLTAAQEKVKSLEEEYRDLGSAHDQLQNNFSSLQLQNARLQQEKTQIELLIADQSHANIIRKRNEVLEEEKSNFERTLASRTEELEIVQQEKLTLQEKLHNLESDSKDQFHDLEQQFDSAIAEADVLRHKLEEETSEREKIVKALGEIDTQFAPRQNGGSEAKAGQTVNDLLKNLQQKLQLSQQSIDALKSEVEQERSRANGAAVEFRAKVEEYTQLRVQLDVESKKNIELQRTAQTVQSELETLKNIHESKFERTVGGLTSELKQSLDTLHDKNIQNAQLEQKIISTVAALDASKLREATLTALLEQSKERAIQTTRDIGEKGKSCEALEISVKDLQTKLTTQTESMRSTAVQLEAASVEIEKLKAALANQTLALHRQETVSRATAEQLREQVSLFDAEVESFRQVNMSFDGLISEQSGGVADSLNPTLPNTSEGSGVNIPASSGIADTGEQQQDPGFSSLRTLLHRASAHLKSEVRHVFALKSKIQDMVKAQAERDCTIEALRSRLETVTHDAQQVEGSLADLKQKMVESADELRRCKLEVASLLSENKAMEKRVADAQTELASKRTQLEAQTIDFSRERSQSVERVQQEIQRVTEVLDQQQNNATANFQRLSKQYEQKLSEVDELRRVLVQQQDAFSTQRSVLEREVGKLKTTLIAEKDAREEANAQVEVLRAKMEVLESKLSTSEQVNKEKFQRCEKLESENVAISDRLQRELHAAEEKLTRAAATELQLRAEVDRLLKDKHEQDEVWKQTIKKFETECVFLTEEAKQREQATIEEFQVKLTAAEQQIEEVLEQNTAFCSELKRMQFEMTVAVKEKERATMNLQKVEELNLATREATTVGHFEIEAALRQRTQDVARLKTDMQCKQRELESLRSTLDDQLNAALQDLRISFQSKELEKDTEIKALEEKIRHHQLQKESEMANLTSLLEQQGRTVASLQSILEQKNTAINILQESHLAVNSEREELIHRVSKLEIDRSGEAASKDALRKQIAFLEAQEADRSSEMNRSKSELAEARRHLLEMSAELSSLRLQYGEQQKLLEVEKIGSQEKIASQQQVFKIKLGTIQQESVQLVQKLVYSNMRRIETVETTGRSQLIDVFLEGHLLASFLWRLLIAAVESKHSETLKMESTQRLHRSQGDQHVERVKSLFHQISTLQLNLEEAEMRLTLHLSDFILQRNAMLGRTGDVLQELHCSAQAEHDLRGAVHQLRAEREIHRSKILVLEERLEGALHENSSLTTQIRTLSDDVNVAKVKFTESSEQCVTQRVLCERLQSTSRSLFETACGQLTGVELLLREGMNSSLLSLEEFSRFFQEVFQQYQRDRNLWTTTNTNRESYIRATALAEVEFLRTDNAKVERQCFLLEQGMRRMVCEQAEELRRCAIVQDEGDIRKETIIVPLFVHQQRLLEVTARAQCNALSTALHISRRENILARSRLESQHELERRSLESSLKRLSDRRIQDLSMMSTISTVSAVTNLSAMPSPDRYRGAGNVSASILAAPLVQLLESKFNILHRVALSTIEEVEVQQRLLLVGLMFEGLGNLHMWAYGA